MSTPPLHWDTRALQQQLDPLLPGLSIEVVESAVSTNTALLERTRMALAQRAPPVGPSVGPDMAPSVEPDVGPDVAPSLEPDVAPSLALAVVRRSVESAAFGRRADESPAVQPCLLVAEQQTAGRGRQGRAWHSAPGASLTFSLVLPMQVTNWAGLSLAVGVAVADALDPRANRDHERVHIGLKWPNDLWLMDGEGEGRKLGGILIETIASGMSRLAVIGIGLNVRPMVVSDASAGFASLQELDQAATAPSVLHRLAQPLALALRQFERTGFSGFVERFAARDLLRGHTVRTTQPDVPEGVAQGVSLHGALLVQTAAGLQTVTSGEVSVRRVGAPATRPPAATTAGIAPRGVHNPQSP